MYKNIRELLDEIEQALVGISNKEVVLPELVAREALNKMIEVKSRIAIKKEKIF